MNVLKLVSLNPFQKNLFYELESNTSVNELLTFIKEQEQILGNVNTWICYSVQRHICLNINDEVGNIDQENFVVFCQNHLEKAKYINVSVQPQNFHIQIKAISSTLVSDVLDYISKTINFSQNFDNWTCRSQSQDRFLDLFEKIGESDTDNFEITTNNIQIVKRIKIGQNVQFSISVPITTTIIDLLQQIKTSHQIQGDILSWTCFSYQLNQQLNLNSVINQINEEVLQVNTYNNMNLLQTSFDIFNTYQTTNNISNQVFQTQHYLSQGDQEKIQLNIEIKDGSQIRYGQFFYNLNLTFEEVAQSILNYLSIQIHYASIDLFINGLQYNNLKDRNQTLRQSKIKNNSTVTAIVRWIDVKAILQ